MATYNRRTIKEESINWLALLTGIFVFIMLSIFPLVFHNYYFDILQTKTVFFCISVGILIALLLIYGLLSGSVKKYIIELKLSNSLKSLKVVDITILLFILVSIISTLQSDYKYEAFWGDQGRHTGLFLWLIYGMVYFIVTRFFKYKTYYIDLFLITGNLVCLFGITDYFRMDILGFKAEMLPEQMANYTSTFGNINTYTAYVGLIISISFILFAKNKDSWKKSIFYYTTTIIGFFAIIMAASDNAYLSISALFLFAPFYLFATKRGLRKYLIMLVSFLSVIKIIDIINMIMKNKVFGIYGLFDFIATSNYLIYAILLLFILILVLYINKLRIKKPDDKIGSWLRWGWLVLTSILIGTFLYVLYLYNFTDAKNMSNSDIARYLVFDDHWGSNRGYIWRILFELFNDFSITRKLFGFGPDTFGILTILYKYKEMISNYGVVFESAHNEYLQFLVTTGILGLSSYVIFLCSALYRMVVRGIKSPVKMSIFFAVLSYCTQALVNINLPIVTPIMMILLMIGVSDCSGSNELEV